MEAPQERKSLGRIKFSHQTPQDLYKMQLNEEFPVHVSQPSVPKGEEETAAAVKWSGGQITKRKDHHPFK